MKKLLVGLLVGLGLLAAKAEGAPLMGYVQIGTSTAITPTLQNGAINVSSGTVRTLRATNLTVGSTATITGVSGSTITYSSATFTSAALGTATITSATISGGTFTGAGVFVSTITASSATLTNISATNVTATTVGTTNFTATASTSTNFNASVSSITTLGVNALSVTGSQTMNSHKITSLSNGTAAADAAAFGQIFLYQRPVVCYSTTTANNATASYVATASSCTISMTDSTHHVLAMVTGEVSTNNASGGIMEIALFRGGGTNVCAVLGGASACSTMRSDGTFLVTTPLAFNVMDAPGTTSATTYIVNIKSDDAVHTMQWLRDQPLGSITLFEIP